MRYYRPTPHELLNTPNLELEMYDEKEKSWTKFTYDSSVHMNIPLDDLRVRYLDSTDFDALGYVAKKIFLREAEVIIFIKGEGTEEQEEKYAHLEDGEEVTNKMSMYEEEKLIIVNKGKVPVGFFYPFKPLKNIKLGFLFHTVKNGTELKRLLR